ncbi:Sigma factor RpoE negative regulatory protein RseB precursor [hydrothermal vent metagenome]|uniref:Sigma factor RpoE negative regulatory protein RseB n=1 Tax=hydrothermal vent metagenome TaxID=652676 RepID=A0A3B0YQ81_9ZZZZ
MGGTLPKLLSLLILLLLTPQVFAGLDDAVSEISPSQLSGHTAGTSSETILISATPDSQLIASGQTTETGAADSSVVTSKQGINTDSVDSQVVTSIQTKDTDSVDYWLDKMTHSMRQQNFQGTLIINQDSRLRAVKVKQGITDEGSWQTLESLTGANQKIIRSNNKVTTIFPAKQLVTISDSTNKRPLHTALPENYRKLKKYYIMKMSGKDRIANKSTQVVRMIPLDEYRYGYIFWLDRQSGLLLRCDLLNENHQVLEQLMYSDIELLSAAPENTIDQSVLENYQQISLLDDNELTTKTWRAKQLPVGFLLTQSVQIPTKNTESKSYHLVFSDGMASVSVFIEVYGEIKKPAIGLSSMGAVNAYSSYVNGIYITAIGEVPASTVRMIALSIEPVSEPVP